MYVLLSQQPLGNSGCNAGHGNLKLDVMLLVVRRKVLEESNCGNNLQFKIYQFYFPIFIASVLIISYDLHFYWTSPNEIFCNNQEHCCRMSHWLDLTLELKCFTLNNTNTKHVFTRSWHTRYGARYNNMSTPS